MDEVEVTVRREAVELLEERMSVIGFNEPVRPVEGVAERVTVPENAFRLVVVIDEVADEPAINVRELGLALSEKSGVMLAGWTASPTMTQSALRGSPNPTAKLVTGAFTISYSAAIGAPGLDVMNVNPVPGVSGAAPCQMPPITMSPGLLVETNADASVLSPLAVLGNEAFGSKGELKLAPVMPNAISPLYSPPY